MSRNLKAALPIALVMDLLIAGSIAFACGVTSDIEPVDMSSTSTGPVEPDAPGCQAGTNNYRDGIYCYCNEGYTWCDTSPQPASLDCCHIH